LCFFDHPVLETLTKYTKTSLFFKGLLSSSPFFYR
jgi:hypothetical protein